MIQSEEQQFSNNSIDALQQYANQLEQAIILKQQSIEAQRVKFFEIIKKVSFDFDVHNIEPQDIDTYLKSIALIPEDFDEPLIKNKNNIIRIKMVQEQQVVQEATSKQKRKYIVRIKIYLSPLKMIMNRYYILDEWLSSVGIQNLFIIIQGQLQKDQELNNQQTSQYQPRKMLILFQNYILKIISINLQKQQNLFMEKYVWPSLMKHLRITN